MNKKVIIILIFVVSKVAFSQEFKGIEIGVENSGASFHFSVKEAKMTLFTPELKEAQKPENYYFVYQKVSGDFKFSVNVDSNYDVNSQNRIGLMIRNSEDENSVFSEIGIQESETNRIFKRKVNSGFGGAKKKCLITLEPDFLVMERKADTVYYKISNNGGPLKNYGIDILKLKDTVQVGMFIKSALGVQVNQVEFQNVKLEKL